MMLRFASLLLMALAFSTSVSAQDDTRDGWWKRLFKPETVEVLDSTDTAPPTETKPKISLGKKAPKDSSDLVVTPLAPTGPGTVLVTAPAALDSLQAHLERNPPSLHGYRIQIFQGTLSEAKAARQQFLSGTDVDPVHLVQNRPYFAVRIGDFRTELEAYKRMMELRAVFPGAYVVADRIEWPPLDEVVEPEPEVKPEVDGLKKGLQPQK